MLILAAPFLFIIFLFGFTRSFMVIFPINLMLAFFHSQIFAGVDATTDGLNPSYLAALASTSWTTGAVLSGVLLALCIVAEVLGAQSRVLTGFLPRKGSE